MLVLPATPPAIVTARSLPNLSQIEAPSSFVMPIGLKRAYDPPTKSDGRRILVDRVWPRGIAKDDLRIDAWLKDLAPSTALRKWFGHDQAKWDEFRKRYARELEPRSEALEELLEMTRAGHVTLVFSAKDIEHNNAVALREHLERRLKS